MSAAAARYLLGAVCAALLSLGPAASPAKAWLWHSGCCPSGYGYGAYYRAPVTYTAGYRYTAAYGYGSGCGYGGCCLTSLFRGCGLFGCYRPTYAACYAPASCNSCGTCGYGSCGTCGYGCSSCGTCGSGCATGNCATGDCGISSSPSTYSGESATNPSTPTNPGTYAPKSIPESDMGDPAGGFVLPAESGDGGQNAPGGFGVERGGVKWDSNKTPADAEPGAGGDGAAQPLKIDSHLVYRMQPERSRVHYRAVFHAPSVARAEVPAGSDWTPIKTDTQLASSN